MNKVSVFNFKDTHQVRIQVVNNEPVFCLKDVCLILGIQNSRDLTSKQLDSKGVEKIYTLTNGGNQELIFINEPNLYRVIFRSNKPEAKQFQDWVFNDVLPALRKTGEYKIKAPKTSSYLPEYRKAKAIEMATKSAVMICNQLTNLSTIAHHGLIASIVNSTVGEEVIPLPRLENKTYSATEVGEKLGISSKRVGAIANANNLKTDEYGIMVLDKSRYSDKQVETFRYNEKAIEVIAQIIKNQH